jgi:hypothetical protein
VDVPLTEGLGSTAPPTCGLAKEAAMLIRVDNLQRVMKRLMNWVMLVEMPLEIRTLPIQKPLVARPIEPNAGDVSSHKLRLLLVVGYDRKDLDGMTLHLEFEIEARANIFWRTTLRHELGKRSPIDLLLELSEGHTEV